MGSGPAAAAPPTGNSLEMQILCPSPLLTERESLGGAQQSVLLSPLDDANAGPCENLCSKSTEPERNRTGTPIQTSRPQVYCSFHSTPLSVTNVSSPQLDCTSWKSKDQIRKTDPVTRGVTEVVCHLTSMHKCFCFPNAFITMISINSYILPSY